MGLNLRKPNQIPCEATIMMTGATTTTVFRVRVVKSCPTRRLSGASNVASKTPISLHTTELCTAIKVIFEFKVGICNRPSQKIINCTQIWKKVELLQFLKPNCFKKQSFSSSFILTKVPTWFLNFTIIRLNHRLRFWFLYQIVLYIFLQHICQGNQNRYWRWCTFKFMVLLSKLAFG